MYTCDVSLPARNEAHGTFLCIQTSVTFMTSRVSLQSLGARRQDVGVQLQAVMHTILTRGARDVETRCTLSWQGTALSTCYACCVIQNYMLHALQILFTLYFMSMCPVSCTHPLFAI